MEPNPQEQPVQPNIPPVGPNRHLNLIPTVIVGLLMLFLGLGGGYLFFAGKNQIKQSTANVPSPTIQQVSPTVTPIPTPVSTRNWKTYQSVNYNFGFLYPENWIISENSPKDSYEPFIVTVTNPSDNFQFIFGTNIFGAGGKCDDNPNHDLGHSSLTFIKKPINLFLYGDKAKNLWSTGYLLGQEQPCPNIAFFDISEIGGVSPQTNTRGGLEALTIKYKDKEFVNFEEFKKSGNLEIVKAILNSFY